MEEDLKPIEYKFILLGDSSVGKSSIFQRLSGCPFNECNSTTIGMEKIILKFKNVQIEEDVQQNFQILLIDTAGQERYKSIAKTYFKDSQGIVLIYSIIDKTSFEHIQIWLDSIKDSLSDWKRSGYMIMLLGNKLDIVEENKEKRVILTEEAEKICSEQDIYWGGECSAKTFDENQLKEIFKKFVKEIYLKLGNDFNSNKQIIRLMAKNKKIKKHKRTCIDTCIEVKV